MHTPIPWIGLAAIVAMFLLPWLDARGLLDGPRTIRRRPRRVVCADCRAPWTRGHQCAGRLEAAVGEPVVPPVPSGTDRAATAAGPAHPHRPARLARTAVLSKDARSQPPWSTRTQTTPEHGRAGQPDQRRLHPDPHPSRLPSSPPLLLAHAKNECGLRPSIRRWAFVESAGALAATWEVQMAQLLVVDSDSAQTAQAIHGVVGW
jgi:hypothetical protein